MAPTQMAGSLRPLLAQAGNSDRTLRDCSPEAPRPRAGVPPGGCRLASLGLGSGDPEAERGRETLKGASEPAREVQKPLAPHCPEDLHGCSLTPGPPASVLPTLPTEEAVLPK